MQPVKCSSVVGLEELPPRYAPHILSIFQLSRGGECVARNKSKSRGQWGLRYQRVRVNGSPCHMAATVMIQEIWREEYVESNLQTRLQLFTGGLSNVQVHCSCTGSQSHNITREGEEEEEEEEEGEEEEVLQSNCILTTTADYTN
ncbi:hypothetical protein EYF80_002493 [Liparis tanakae]|uniref:Uncharacterized protein n=1 Tax=Liparis tanakae TaxID=230148 RepID=A0A4Z2JBC2_9TELE|nr:hypothetical protein EYF80_002493 [Liparis tanakae]